MASRVSGGALKARGRGICLVVSSRAQKLLLPEECWRAFRGSTTRADSPRLQRWGYLTYLFPDIPSSYFLGELQRCLKDPDWLAQLFIKHVRLEKMGWGRGLEVDGTLQMCSPFSPTLLFLKLYTY